MEDLIGEAGHEMVSGPCVHPGVFFVLGIAIFRETLLRFGRGRQLLPMWYFTARAALLNSLT